MLFFIKVYKLILYDSKITFGMIGTVFYLPFRVFRSFMVILISVAVIGSIFYGVGYLIFIYGSYYESDLLWINTITFLNVPIVKSSFRDQLLYTMYWSMSTASTAAYGDISAGDPI